MKAAILFIFKVLPLIFGLGFIAPLIAQTLPLLGVSNVLGAPALMIGLGVGGVWGAIATKTGRWI
jgi:hypothetical protein